MLHGRMPDLMPQQSAAPISGLGLSDFAHHVRSRGAFRICAAKRDICLHMSKTRRELWILPLRVTPRRICHMLCSLPLTVMMANTL